MDLHSRGSPDGHSTLLYTPMAAKGLRPRRCADSHFNGEIPLLTQTIYIANLQITRSSSLPTPPSSKSPSQTVSVATSTSFFKIQRRLSSLVFWDRYPNLLSS